MLQVLVTLMAIDYALGVVLALVWKRSNKTADGSFESRASVKGAVPQVRNSALRSHRGAP